MKLEKVDAPFDKEWKSAYIIINRENRRMICLYKDDNTRKTISYARYLMSVKLGRELTNEETVDHIDNDKTNDSVENLQILSIEENRDKYVEIIPHNIHGTGSMYKKGCRCDLCKKWKHDYSEAYYKKHPEKLIEYRRKDIEKVCNNCKKIFYVDVSHKNKRFCSIGCSNSYRNKNKKII